MSSVLPTLFSEMSVSSVMNNTNIPEGCVTTHFSPVVIWENKDNVVLKEVDTIANLLFAGICLPLLFIVSLFTNIINMIAFYKHGLQERINVCLFTLSLLDLLSTMVSFVYNSDVMYMFIVGKGDALGPSARFFIENHLSGSYSLMTSSQLVYTVIALDRCLCIIRPLAAKRFILTKTTVVMLWSMVLIITGCGWFIMGVRYSVVCVVNPEDNSISYRNYPRQLYFQNKWILDFMYSTVYGMALPGLSFVCVTVCTIVTATQLKKLSQWRGKVSSVSDSLTSRDLAITRVIIGTSILFIICIVPSVVMRTSFLIFPEIRLGGRYDNLAWLLRRVHVLASAVNNTFNFFIYYVYGSKFRETTQRLISSCFHRIITHKGSVKSSNMET